jgi:beta-glucosidase
MKRRNMLLSFATAGVATALLGALPSWSADAVGPRPWMSPDLSPDRGAELLEAAMTPDERLALLHGYFPLMMKPRPADVLPSPGFVPGIPRLGVPALRETDASLGVANYGRDNDRTTPLPSGLALASSWNTEIAYDGGRMIGAEARQMGFNVMLAGGVNLVRDPRNGRNFEYAGEDPLLAGEMAGASIRGIQSNHIVSITKHLVLNDQETGRHVFDAVIDPAALRESDLLAFEIAIERGQPGAVMCAYNRINGAYACENGPMLGALKRDWGFRGWVMSDWGATHSTVGSALAGLDQESGVELDAKVFFGEPLKVAIAAGELPASRLRDMNRRILRSLFATGVMDHPTTLGALATDPAHAAVARRAAEQGLVLLRNDGVLPLAPNVRRLVVIGGHADVGVLSGGGSSQVLPVGSVRLPAPADAPAWVRGVVYHPSSPLQAIRRRAPGMQVTYDDGEDPARAAAAARDADFAIVFATQWTSEGADYGLALPDRQDALVEAVAVANPRTIVVLETGGPVLTPWADKVAGLVEAWYPGAEGGEAIAEALFGEIDPSGRLPVSFPESEAQLPNPQLPGQGVSQPETLDFSKSGPSFTVTYPEGADVGYRWYERTQAQPRFPFGYGLSYTRFRYSKLRATGGRTLTVSFDVTNVGTRAGLDVPQVYAAPAGRMHRLVGWRKVSLRPGQTERVQVTADPRLLADFRTAQHDWRVAAGDLDVRVGEFAGDAQLHAHARLVESRLKP